MAALTTDRHTIERPGDIYSFPIAANTLCYAGGLATVTASGYVRPGTVDASSPASVAVGRFCRRANNLTGADPMFDMTVSTTAQVEAGVFRWDNSTSDPVTIASLRHLCYVVDDQTVAATSAPTGTPAVATRGIAGIVMDVDTNGVWVATGLPVVAS